MMKAKMKKSIPSVKKAAVKSGTIKAVKAPVKKISKPVKKTPTPKVAITEKPTASALESIRQEVAALRTHLVKSMAPVTTGTLEEVDALRRVLNDLMDARMNDVISELVGIRNTAASCGGEARRVTEQMDTLLSDLGAMKFEAERLEHVDPLIHTVTREISDSHLPDGVVTETIRPGFHTGRGIVVAKALVAVNRRS